MGFNNIFGISTNMPILNLKTFNYPNIKLLVVMEVPKMYFVKLKKKNH